VRVTAQAHPVVVTHMFSSNEAPHAMGIELGLGHMQAKRCVWE
jgi:CBS-domain-containing membrane protein